MCLHMYDPHEPHLTATKCIHWNLQGTLDHGLLLHCASMSDLVIYTDANWAGCPNTRWSTLDYTVFLGNNRVSWSSKCQNVISHSECWLHQLLVELHSLLSQATLVYCDNISDVDLSTNPVQHQHTKHIEIDLHFVHERVAVRDVRVLHVLTTSQFIDIFTKGLPSSVFSEFWSSLNICSGFSFDCREGVLEDSCIGGLLGCVCIGLLALVWGEAHPLGYIIIILLLKLIEQPLLPM
jgi:hypothetical protein